LTNRLAAPRPSLRSSPARVLRLLPWVLLSAVAACQSDDTGVLASAGADGAVQEGAAGETGTTLDAWSDAGAGVAEAREAAEPGNQDALTDGTRETDSGMVVAMGAMGANARDAFAEAGPNGDAADVTTDTCCGENDGTIQTPDGEPDDVVSDMLPRDAEAGLDLDAEAGGDAEGGGDADAETPTRERIIEKTSLECYQCAQENGCLDAGATCEDLAASLAAAGPQAGQSREQLCLDTLSCTLGSQCYLQGSDVCVCGAAPLDVCSSTGPQAGDGANCVSEEQSALETTDPSTELDREYDPIYGAGMANNIVACILNAFCDACLF
jgi:hypothetical protein